MSILYCYQYDRCDLKLPSGNISGCPDLTILPPKSCYPLPWWEWERYMQDNPQLTQELLGDHHVLVLHTWHQHSGHVPVQLHSSQPYAAAARVRCPITVSHAQGVM
ncbi:hypothetical protein Pmani_038933 [Petrolisthes manimaculis]|uniref:Alpha 1,4-glycosyltransferase domain-containing protein n=1 Tax=Petrolisthes manimaculis TaxID=1843537 RepID=A0AAE1NEP6_9EUCA|nr:hypothetical protein Pmani_038933 [Petrolisthes manimaculis]